MFAAKAAALRTLDLSRQVGAAIFSRAGEVIALGSNEVPKGGGGSYWPDDPHDNREYVRGYDSNDQRKREVLGQLISLINLNKNVDDVLNDPKVRDSQFMDALEYGRIVHAEMSAISDAARLGRSLKDSILFCTTFPCHMCAKHIVSSGISGVVFLEPYPKSLAPELQGDSLWIEGNDRGQFETYPAVRFDHFHGVTPRRYRELFERGKRKDALGQFVPYIGGSPIIFVRISAPTYAEFERMIILRTTEILRDILGDAADRQ